MKISDKNVRATALQEFWTDEYPESIYLWQGAKHERTLSEIENCNIPTQKDLFATQNEIQKGHDFCKAFYYRILPELTRRLNTAHNLDLSVSFWQMAFGYWLYRHISVVYDKYVYLSLLDIDSTSLKLLSKDDYFIPQNHVDYIFCFASDFGVQQLVSQYYRLYKKKTFPETTYSFSYPDNQSHKDGIHERLERKYSILKCEPQVALLGTYFSQLNSNILKDKSQGKVGRFVLPPTDKRSLAPDFGKRDLIVDGGLEDSFENYFIQSLYYCLPKDLIEEFPNYYNRFQIDISCRQFTHIVSENWISNIRHSIFIAVAKQNNRTFICLEHAAGTYYYKNYMQFIDFDVADGYLSVGWKNDHEKLIQGGFSARDIVPYKSDPQKKTILFLGHTRFIYWQAFNETHATNSTFTKKLKIIARILELLPAELKVNFLFRPRPGKYFWDVERILELDKHNIRCDRGDFSTSIAQSRIVVIDHLSTGLAEILLMNVPFMLVHDVRFIPLKEELKLIFEELIDCGVIHTTAESAVAHLSSIYENVDMWWQSEPVRRSVNQLTDLSLAPASKTTDYLLSLLSDESMRPPNLWRRCMIGLVTGVWKAYRAVIKVKSIFTSRAT